MILDHRLHAVPTRIECFDQVGVLVGEINVVEGDERHQCGSKLFGQLVGVLLLLLVELVVHGEDAYFDDYLRRNRRLKVIIKPLTSNQSYLDHVLDNFVWIAEITRFATILFALATRRFQLVQFAHSMQIVQQVRPGVVEKVFDHTLLGHFAEQLFLYLQAELL